MYTGFVLGMCKGGRCCLLRVRQDRKNCLRLLVNVGWSNAWTYTGFVVAGGLSCRFLKTVRRALCAWHRSLRGRLLESLCSAYTVDAGVSERSNWRTVSNLVRVLELRCDTVSHACFLVSKSGELLKLRIEWCSLPLRNFAHREAVPLRLLLAAFVKPEKAPFICDVMYG